MSEKVVSFEEYEAGIVKIRNEQIEEWLNRKGGLLNMADTIVAAKVMMKLIEKIKPSGYVSLEWLKNQEEIVMDNLSLSEASEFEFKISQKLFSDLLLAASNEAGKGAKEK
jgi:hypothetical protein